MAESLDSRFTAILSKNKAKSHPGRMIPTVYPGLNINALSFKNIHIPSS